MPELPEVETMARLVRPALLGRHVTDVEVAWERTLGGVGEAEFRRLVLGKRLVEVERRAQYLLLGLAGSSEGSPSAYLVVHLRMTGRLVVVEHGGVDEPRSPWMRLGLELGAVPGGRGARATQGGRGRLEFIDPRKFGRVVATEDPAEVLPDLGPEPLGEAFTAAWLREALAGRQRQLKPLLLDQAFLAGLGNIYVDESLFRARLHPLTPAARVSSAKSAALHRAVREVLAEAIEREGSSFDTFYRTPEGNPGSYQHQFAVYGRTGRPCRRCGAKVRRVVVGQRGTHFCPRCQRAPRA